MIDVIEANSESVIENVNELNEEELEEKEKALSYFKEIGDNAKAVTDLAQQLIGKLKNGDLNCSDGISLLDVKNHLMTFYLLNMAQVIIMKSNGKSIVNNPCIDMLVELRVILEKIRPIDQKLKYQIDKLVKIAVTGKVGDKDPSRFKANPDNMKSEILDDESEIEESDDEKTKKKNVYVPPRLSAVHYDGDETKVEKRQKLIDRARKHALQSSVMQELKEEYLDTPVEIKMTNSLRQKEDKHLQRKKEFEEEFMTRLPTTKQDKRRSKRFSLLSTIGDEVTKFEDTSILLGDESSIGKKNKSRKRQLSGNKRGKKKKRKTQ